MCNSFRMSPALICGLIIAALTAAWFELHSRSEVQRINLCLQSLLSGDTQARQRAELDLQYLGTNAIPVIARALRRRGSTLETVRVRLAEHCVWLPLRVRTLGERQAAALKACSLLGPRAAALVEPLAELLVVAPNIQVAVALSALEENAVPVVCRTLVHRSFDTRYFSMLALSGACKRMATRAAGADGSLSALQMLRDRLPETAVPDLIENLGSDEVRLRTAAAWTLNELGELSASAAPALRAALLDPEPMVSHQARRALETIRTTESVQ